MDPGKCGGGSTPCEEPAGREYNKADYSDTRAAQVQDQDHKSEQLRGLKMSPREEGLQPPNGDAANIDTSKRVRYKKSSTQENNR
ncbi:hypothetical protein PAHAL_9G362700 [Panicum hallii]|uniref:Uncharacterized protein n=1 Tax=Panicum hallii TaxID=206008 RepID=A0A2T8I3P2_9POAL|nr:hypothetical protein PAHAL_9G362700 [Panicum hallii]